MMFYVMPYRQGSKSARALADALGGKVLKIEREEPFKAGNRSPIPKIINWGRTDDTGIWTGEAYTFNTPLAVRSASNKRIFFNRMTDAGLEELIPQYYVNKGDIPNEAFPIVCRTVLAGHSGAGIVIADSVDQLVDAPLYVEYIPKKEEYRIHVGKISDTEAVVIAVQRKARKRDVPDNLINWKIRNHANGFVYARQDVEPDASTLEMAKQALLATGLDFGAVDIIWNAKKGKGHVLEVNTAPGLEGQTIEDYANFFRRGND